MDQDYVFKESKLDVSEIKPGYVLNEEIREVSNMRPGRVLTYSDVEKLKELLAGRTVRIMMKETDTEEIRKNKEKSKETEDKKIEQQMFDKLSKIIEQDVNREKSIHDEGNHQKMKSIIEAKKKLIRGHDYQERTDSIKQQHLEKYGESLKEIHSHTKKEALQSIEHFARASADFDSILRVEGVEMDAMFRKLNEYEEKVAKFLDAVSGQKKIFSSYVEEIVLDVVNDIGYKLQMALFSLISKTYHHFDYMVSHSLQVLIISLVTAIEMTRIINEKVESFSQDEFRKFMAINSKTFTLEELINVGLAALLHDVDLRNKLPQIDRNYKFTIQDASTVDLHASNSFHVSQLLNVGFDVQRAVYQHHERYDGSGYPNGLMPRFFTKYTPVIMFAEYYVEMSTPGPFSDKVYTPRAVLLDLLKNKREQFDGDMTYAFIRAASLYPVGTWVYLSDETIGVVIDINRDQLEKPIIKVIFDKQFRETETRRVDMLKEADIKIVKSLDIESVVNANPNVFKHLLK